MIFGTDFLDSVDNVKYDSKFMHRQAPFCFRFTLYSSITPACISGFYFFFFPPFIRILIFLLIMYGRISFSLSSAFTMRLAFGYLRSR